MLSKKNDEVTYVCEYSILHEHHAKVLVWKIIFYLSSHFAWYVCAHTCVVYAYIMKMILNTLFVQNKIQPHTHKYDSDIHANLNNKMMIKRSVSVCLCGIKIKERLDLNFYYIFFSVLLLILKKKFCISYIWERWYNSEKRIKEQSDIIINGGGKAWNEIKY